MLILLTYIFQSVMIGKDEQMFCIFWIEDFKNYMWIHFWIDDKIIILSFS